MEIDLTAEQEAQLFRVASHEGKPVGQLLTECAAYVLRENDRFRAEVEEGLAAAERGEFVEEDEMDARVEAMFKR
jgi:predicted transcriptional regulator